MNGKGLWVVAGALALIAADVPEAPEDAFTRDWYTVEVIVVQRPAVLEATTVEQLTAEEPARLPGEALNITGRGTPMELDLITWMELLNPPMPAPYSQPEPPPELNPELEVADGAPDEATLEDDAVEDTATEVEEETAPGTLDAPIEIAMDELLEMPFPEEAQVPTPEQLWLSALTEFEAQLESTSFASLPEASLRMTVEANRLRRRRGYEVLAHFAWLQPVPERGAPQPVLVQAGPRADVDVGHRLEGAIAVTLGRYLHVRSTLSYREPGLGLQPVSLAYAITPDSAVETDTATAWDATRVMVMDVSRRMRSGEIHYLDHPKLGLLVRIDPVEPDETLTNAFEAWLEDLESDEGT